MTSRPSGRPAPLLQPCDIVLTQGGEFISLAIRWFERRPGNPAIVNHAGVITRAGNWLLSRLVEALTTVLKHSPWSQYAKTGTKLLIYRPRNLTPDQRLAIVAKAESYVGRHYDYWKIPLHALDGLIGKVVRREVTLFRRLCNDNGPICSWVVAEAYRAAGLDFGIPARMADPDDIGDFCARNPDKYDLIWALAPIP